MCSQHYAVNLWQFSQVLVRYFYW